MNRRTLTTGKWQKARILQSEGLALYAIEEWEKRGPGALFTDLRDAKIGPGNQVNLTWHFLTEAEIVATVPAIGQIPILEEVTACKAAAALENNGELVLVFHDSRDTKVRIYRIKTEEYYAVALPALSPAAEKLGALPHRF